MTDTERSKDMGNTKIVVQTILQLGVGGPLTLGVLADVIASARDRGRTDWEFVDIEQANGRWCFTFTAATPLASVGLDTHEVVPEGQPLSPPTAGVRPREYGPPAAPPPSPAEVEAFRQAMMEASTEKLAMDRAGLPASPLSPIDSLNFDPARTHVPPDWEAILGWCAVRSMPPDLCEEWHGPHVCHLPPRHSYLADPTVPGHRCVCGIRFPVEVGT